MPFVIHETDSSGAYIRTRLDNDDDYWNRPFPKAVFVRRVQHEAKEMSAQIFTQYHFLHDILSRHEMTIQRRWGKKKLQQRQKLLLEVWPDMSEKHRPDVDALRRRQKHGKPTARDKDALMWPYINQEDLCARSNVLLLLNTRGRHPPSRFARADLEAMILGQQSNAIQKSFLDHHTMVLNVESESEYGKLIAWTGDDTAFQWFKNRRQFAVDEGLMILECQVRLLKFLVDLTKTLLHDIPESALLDDTYPRQLAPMLASTHEGDGIVSLPMLVVETSYRPPFDLDLNRIQTMLAAQASAKSDHRWSMKEDPGYFAECVMLYSEHRPEHIIGINGGIHPWLEKGITGMFGGMVLQDVVNRTHEEADLFLALQLQAKSFQDVHSKHDVLLNDHQPVLDEYIKECMGLENGLQKMKKLKLEELKYCAASSPDLRACFVRELPDDPGEPRFRIQINDCLRPDDARNDLIYILRTMWEAGSDLQVVHLHVFVDELERLVRSESQVKPFVSSFVAEIIDDLGVIAECLRQVYLHMQYLYMHRHMAVPEGFMVYLQDALLPDRTGWHGTHYDARMLPLFEALNTLGDPADGKFHYPADKRRTRDTVEALRKAEWHLDVFWTGIYRIMPQTGDFREKMHQYSQVQRTPKWVEAATEHVSSRPISGTQEVPLSEIYADLESRTSATISDGLEVEKRKPKIKTKGVPNPNLAQGETIDELDTPGAQEHQTIISVNRRAFKTFRALFFDPSVTSAAGEVPWKDFLHAMTSIGFSAEKLWGSAWQFEPVAVDSAKTPIQFHEPHPEPKIRWQYARTIGRRLGLSYGWSSSTFVVEEKKTQEVE